MSDEIVAGGVGEPTAEGGSERLLLPMRVGNATVYIEQTGGSAHIVPTDEVYPVAPSPTEAFETASEVLHECVRVVGERIEALGERARPEEISVEFSLSFEAKGKATLIPVFVTGEAGATTGLKVTAVWKSAQDEEG